MVASHVKRIADRLCAHPHLHTATLHRLRREWSGDLSSEDTDTVLETAQELLESSGVAGARMIAYGIVGNHRAALERLDAAGLERFGAGLASWGEIDMVVKAMSWALRELATRDPESVAIFVAAHEGVLAGSAKFGTSSRLD